MASSWNQVRIDPEALKNNFLFFKNRVGVHTRIMAMVKADGYGHGMIEAARTFESVGCDAFGVGEIGEGVGLRKSGIGGDIFILLGFSRDNVELFFKYNLTPIVFDIDLITLLSQTALRLNREISVHLKVDCGMGRVGVVAEEAAPLKYKIDKLPGIRFGGLMTHFPISEIPGSPSTASAEKRFRTLCSELGDPKPLLHIANSGAVLNVPGSHFDMIRPGIGLYGYYPDPAMGVAINESERLQPAMSMSTQVIQVKRVPAGYGISYGHTYVTEEESVLAVLPIGYEDGYLRSLSNRAQVLIHGKRVPIRGRICMNLCMADVTELSEVSPGDEVVVLGSQGTERITADEIGLWAGTISYEVLCLLGNNNEREYNQVSAIRC